MRAMSTSFGQRVMHVSQEAQSQMAELPRTGPSCPLDHLDDGVRVVVHYQRHRAARGALAAVVAPLDRHAVHLR